MKTLLFVVAVFLNSLCAVFNIPLDIKPIGLDKRVCQDTRNDCSWIGEHNDDVAAYCDRHSNDTFIKQCQKTCGYCKAPAPPQGKAPAPPVVEEVCKDDRNNCSWIGEHNDDVAAYCDRHRNDTFIKQCQKTCGYCKPPAPPTGKAPAPPVVEEVCKDDRNDCWWIGELNEDVVDYCDRHKNDQFIKQCQKTCGYCKPPAPPTVCEDTRYDCDTINYIGEPKESYCRRNRNNEEVKKCAKTCGFCKAPAPPVVEEVCKDDRNDCWWIGELNEDVVDYCDRHKNDQFIKQCQKTCGYC